MENAIDRGIYIGKVKDYSLSSITLSNFKIFQDKSLKSEELLFEAEEVIVDYDLDALSALKRKAALNIGNITFIKSQLTLVRDNMGIFDFVEKFNIDFNNFSGFSAINKMTFKDGNLFYKDYRVTREGGLLTKVKSFNGYFYLENFPKIKFDCSGLREEDSAPLAFKGYLFLDRPDYSLDFSFKDGDITHFQYYLSEVKPFNLIKGLFDLDLHLTNNSDVNQDKIVRYGKISLKDLDLFPKYLSNMEIKQAEGSVTFDSKEIIIEKITAHYKNSPFTLIGNLTYADEFGYNMKVKSDDFQLSDLKESLKEYISLSPEFQAEGKSNLSFEVSGSEENYQVKGELSTVQGKIQEYNFSHLKTEKVELSKVPARLC